MVYVNTIALLFASKREKPRRSMGNDRVEKQHNKEGESPHLIVHKERQNEVHFSCKTLIMPRLDIKSH